MLSFKSLDPKLLLPKLYKIGLYTLSTEEGGTSIQI